MFLSCAFTNAEIDLAYSLNDEVIERKMSSVRSNSISNRDVASFLVTKHSWKGKYKRIFSIDEDGFGTYNPSSLEQTNYVNA
ncbi:hypothetical protein D918_05251 [Trichuris suis]|nr:hypothetical protein D918_05251 [Trichuris suis]